MTTVIKSIAKWQNLRKQPLFIGQQIGFVPTMGNLHEGHLSLLTKAKTENQLTVLSIFVNPTQFNNPDDLAKYPRTLEADITLAEKAKVDFVLTPEVTDLYPDDYRYQIHETQFSQFLCGKHRPGHFNGVLTIVLKLLNLVQPKKAYFGEKDFQQLQLIQEMVKALFLDIEIIACPTIRDNNGLALSSRNSRLTQQEYELALNFPKLLKSKNNCAEIIKALENLGFVVDYIEELCQRRFGAVKIGNVRLIDNIELGG